MNYNLIIIIAAITATLIFGYLLLACKTSLWPFNNKEDFGETQETVTVKADSSVDCSNKANNLPNVDTVVSTTFNPKSKTCTITYAK